MFDPYVAQRQDLPGPHPLDPIMATMGLCPTCEAHFRKTFLAGLAQTFGLRPPEAPLAKAAVIAIGDVVEATRDLIGGRNHVVHFDGIDQDVVAVATRPSPVFGTLVLKGTRGKVLWHAPEGTIVRFDLDGRGRVRALLEAVDLLSLRVVPPAEAPAEPPRAEAPAYDLAALVAERDAARTDRDIALAERDAAEAAMHKAEAFRDQHLKDLTSTQALLNAERFERVQAQTERDVARKDVAIVRAELDKTLTALTTAQNVSRNLRSERDSFADRLETIRLELGVDAPDVLKRIQTLLINASAGAGLGDAAQAELEHLRIRSEKVETTLAEVRRLLQIGPDDTNPLPERVRHLVANYKQARKDREDARSESEAAQEEMHAAIDERNTALEKLAKAEEVFADAITRRGAELDKAVGAIREMVTLARDATFAGANPDPVAPAVEVTRG